jgi:hypothetical protein
MSATLSPATVHAAKPELRAVDAARAVDPAEAEMHRWLIGLGTPFVLGAVFYALSIGTSAEWLIGVALVLGPILFLLATVYLCISSDSNGAPELPVAQGVTAAEQRAA